MALGAETLLAVQEQAQERRFQEEGEHALHGQGLSDHPAREAGEMRPVRAELELHRDARHYPEHKIDAEDLGPEASSLVVNLIVPAQGQGLQYHDQWRQPHGQLRKQVVKSNREGEVQAVNQESAIHLQTPRDLQYRRKWGR